MEKTDRLQMWQIFLAFNKHHIFFLQSRFPSSEVNVNPDFWFGTVFLGPKYSPTTCEERISLFYCTKGTKPFMKSYICTFFVTKNLQDFFTNFKLWYVCNILLFKISLVDSKRNEMQLQTGNGHNCHCECSLTANNSTGE